jgi:hypothetical protein
MAGKRGNRQASVDQSNGKGTTHIERAKSDGTFRCRPLWRAALRPDGVWAAELTADGRVMVMEANHVFDDHR